MHNTVYPKQKGKWLDHDKQSHQYLKFKHLIPMKLNMLNDGTKPSDYIYLWDV